MHHLNGLDYAHGAFFVDSLGRGMVEETVWRSLCGLDAGGAPGQGRKDGREEGGEGMKTGSRSKVRKKLTGK